MLGAVELLSCGACLTYCNYAVGVFQHAHTPGGVLHNTVNMSNRTALRTWSSINMPQNLKDIVMLWDWIVAGFIILLSMQRLFTVWFWDSAFNLLWPRMTFKCQWALNVISFSWELHLPRLSAGLQLAVSVWAVHVAVYMLVLSVVGISWPLFRHRMGKS